jgi:hypothetical protein
MENIFLYNEWTEMKNLFMGVFKYVIANAVEDFKSKI